MKVEQRIGRIDRIGQKYPTVRVINFAYTDTVEADVYFALSERIGLFNGVVGKLQPILSRLPKEFESAALQRREDREKSRHELVQNVQQLVDDADATNFDIDEVSESDLEATEMPVPPFTADQIEQVLRQRNLLPPGIECEELEPGTFSVQIPGWSNAIRVTTNPGIFDEHFESHQLLLHDSPVFREFLNRCNILDAYEENAGGEAAAELDALLSSTLDRAFNGER